MKTGAGCRSPADTPFDPNNSTGTGLSGEYTQSLTSWVPTLPLDLSTGLNAYTSATSGELATYAYNNEYDLTNATGYKGSTGNQVATTYAPDAAGRVMSATSIYTASGAYVRPAATTYVYEPTSNRLASVTDGDGVHTLSYDERGLLETLTVANEGAYIFGYDALKRNNSLTYPDGHKRTQSYDPEGRLNSRCYVYTNGAPSRCYSVVYDADGNPSTMTDPEGTDVIHYDSLNRVTSVTRQVASTPDVTESYAYNAIGALDTNAPETTALALDDQRPRIGGSGPNDTAASPVMNAVNGVTVSVDPAGRVTSLNGSTLAFNKQSNLKSVTTGSSTETYSYDANLRRFARIAGSTTELYLYDGGNVVATLNGNGTTVDQYLYDAVDSPLRLTRAGARYFYEVDLAGNVRRLRDVNGADLGGYRYTAFGQTETGNSATPTPSIDQPLRWKGRWFVNVAGGLYDVRARWWSPQLGAFLSVDEFAYHDRHSTLWGWPRQNPLRWSDPSGRWGFAFGGTGSAEWGIGPGIGAAFTGGFYIGSAGFGAFNTLTSTPVAVSGSVGVGFAIGFYYGDTPGGSSTQVSVSGGDGLLGSASVGNSGVSITLGAGLGASASASDSQTAVEGLDWSGDAVSIPLAVCK